MDKIRRTTLIGQHTPIITYTIFRRLAEKRATREKVAQRRRALLNAALRLITLGTLGRHE